MTGKEVEMFLSTHILTVTQSVGPPLEISTLLFDWFRLTCCGGDSSQSQTRFIPFGVTKHKKNTAKSRLTCYIYSFYEPSQMSTTSTLISLFFSSFFFKSVKKFRIQEQVIFFISLMFKIESIILISCNSDPLWAGYCYHRRLQRRKTKEGKKKICD